VCSGQILAGPHPNVVAADTVRTQTLRGYKPEPGG
jgi:hypothetical protein